VFAPGLISANTARVILSILSNLEEPLSKKGKAFERDMREFFKRQGYETYSFNAKRDGEEYEYDLILPWGD
jgi:predicted fused transcriptional regulator/phosphomethylpyrimidine kinase